MAIKDILLHLGPGERSSERTDVACLLAQAHEAHLTAIYFIAPPYISRAIPASTPVATSFSRRSIKRARKRMR